MLMVNNGQFKSLVEEFSSQFPDLVRPDSTLVQQIVQLVQFMYEGPPTSFDVEVLEEELTQEDLLNLLNLN